MIHPYLAYCNLVWASNYRARLKRLIVLQNRAISVIIGCFNVSCSTDSLYKQLRILKIGQITTLQINEFMYKHYNNLLSPIFSNYFTITSQVNPTTFDHPITTDPSILVPIFACFPLNALVLMPGI